MGSTAYGSSEGLTSAYRSHIHACTARGCFRTHRLSAPKQHHITALFPLAPVVDVATFPVQAMLWAMAHLLPWPETM